MKKLFYKILLLLGIKKRHKRFKEITKDLEKCLVIMGNSGKRFDKITLQNETIKGKFIIKGRTITNGSDRDMEFLFNNLKAIAEELGYSTPHSYWYNLDNLLNSWYSAASKGNILFNYEK